MQLKLLLLLSLLKLLYTYITTCIQYDYVYVSFNSYSACQDVTWFQICNY